MEVHKGRENVSEVFGLLEGEFVGYFQAVPLYLLVGVHFRVGNDDLVENVKTDSRNSFGLHHFHIPVLMQITHKQNERVIGRFICIALEDEILWYDNVQLFARFLQQVFDNIRCAYRLFLHHKTEQTVWGFVVNDVGVGFLFPNPWLPTLFLLEYFFHRRTSALFFFLHMGLRYREFRKGPNLILFFMAIPVFFFLKGVAFWVLLFSIWHFQFVFSWRSFLRKKGSIVGLAEQGLLFVWVWLKTAAAKHFTDETDK